MVRKSKDNNFFHKDKMIEKMNKKIHQIILCHRAMVK